MFFGMKARPVFPEQLLEVAVLVRHDAGSYRVQSSRQIIYYNENFLTTSLVCRQRIQSGGETGRSGRREHFPTTNDKVEKT
jgi:hypothetical protein